MKCKFPKGLQCEIVLFLFQSLFCDPLSVIGVLLMVHTGLVLAQHMSLAWSTQWYQLISEAILLFTNYYSLFKIVRDYIVFSRLSYTDKEGKENWCRVCVQDAIKNTGWIKYINDTIVNQSKNEGNSKCNKFILTQFILFHNQCAAQLFWHFFTVKLVLVQSIFLFV